MPILSRLHLRVAPVCVLLCALVVGRCAVAQTGFASISGRIADGSGAVIQKAGVSLKNLDTGIVIQSQSNSDGVYSFPSVQPGNYVMRVEKQGFRSVDVTGLTIYTQDQLARNFSMEVGSASESITVTAAGTTNDSPAVSMTVDREFVENMPLNGQSFQDLIQLAPGAVSNQAGMYSIDGQRTDSNIYTVDGVSANLGGLFNEGSGGDALSGYAPMQTILGTTQSLASIDSLQEFTIQTTGYAAEYGRSPGGQLQFTTRSGTNDLHGTLFDFFRNTVLDANSDSNDYYGDPKTAEHQNDFGGTFGGPFIVPRLYNGKDKTFYFLSYEGLRLLLPSSESEYVPTQALRNAASPNTQPYLNLKPLPNTSVAGDTCTVSGTTISLTGPTTASTTPCDQQFYYGYSYPERLDNISIRVDHALNRGLHAFLRYAETPSSEAAGVEQVDTQRIDTRTWTGGLTASFTATLLNDFRFNYSRDFERGYYSQTPVNGSIPLQRSLMIPVQYDSAFAEAESAIQVSGSSLSAVGIYGGGGTIQHQYQLIDSLAWTLGHHDLKFGVDWRRLAPNFFASPYEDVMEITSLAGIQQGYANVVNIDAEAPTAPVFHNISVYAQDNWKLSRRLSIDYGLRWEFNPPPGPTNGEFPAVITSNNIATATVAPLGTQPYTAKYDKFAPRFGFAWNAIPAQRHALTVRGGFGIFYDTGQSQDGTPYTTTYPYLMTSSQSNVPLPLSSPALAPPSSTISLTPPYPFLYVTSLNLTIPYTEQWNLSLDEALSSKNTFTLSYVGNNGRKLLFTGVFEKTPYGNSNFPSGLEFTSNASDSSYNALQFQDVGRIAKGLDLVGSFTWAHALDNASTDASLALPIWGNSNYDLRRVLNVALNYQVPTATENRLLRIVTGGWFLANRFSTQSGNPINVIQTTLIQAGSVGGQEVQYFPNLVPGVPIYLHGAAAGVGPGLHNWRLNRNAFSCTPTNSTTACAGTPTEEGDLGRNYLRAPSFWTLNTALQRTFPIYEQLHLNFRADAFNIFNHPNLESPNGSLSSSTFGELLYGSVAKIGSSNSLYAMGGARSLQFSLKLQF